MIFKFLYYKWIAGACRHFCFICKYKKTCHEVNFITQYKLMKDFAMWRKHNK